MKLTADNDQENLLVYDDRELPTEHLLTNGDNMSSDEDGSMEIDEDEDENRHQHQYEKMISDDNNMDEN